MSDLPALRLRLAVYLMASAVVTASSTTARAQPPDAATRVVIATLANDSNPGDLDFQGAECMVAPSGRAMDCAFQQVFLTVAPGDPQTCLVTTNRYERRFEKQDDTRWVSREPPDGPCGLVDVATLVDEGRAVRWSLEFRKTITDRRSPQCRGDDPPAERFSGAAARRALPCRFVRPGAIR